MWYVWRNENKVEEGVGVWLAQRAGPIGNESYDEGLVMSLQQILQQNPARGQVSVFTMISQWLWGCWGCSMHGAPSDGCPYH